MQDKPISNTKIKQILKKIYLSIPEPKFTRLKNLEIFDWMNQNCLDKLILNLGSGIGSCDHYLSKNIKTINLDIDKSKPDLDIIADAHNLPFKDESVDIVYSIAVFEHLKKPWIVADEISRVLKSCGYVVLLAPFLNIIHDKDDYFRFTDKGIRSLFDHDKYDVIFEQVGSGGGSFISVFLYVYLKQFIPTKPLKILWEVFTRYLFCLLKYFDILIGTSKTMRLTANSFSFIGRKR